MEILTEEIDISLNANCSNPTHKIGEKKKGAFIAAKNSIFIITHVMDTNVIAVDLQTGRHTSFKNEDSVFSVKGSIDKRGWSV